MIPLLRQVQIVMGLVSALGSGLAPGVEVRFALLPLVTGSGRLFAGVTGTGGLARLLAKMPWNGRSAGPPGTCAS